MYVIFELEDVSSRPPLPKAAPQMNNDESLERGCMMRSTSRSVSEGLLPAIGVSTQKRKAVSLVLGKEFQ